MPLSVVKFFFGAVCAFTLWHGSAFAQICGDADGNGQVSVTDGVQALRAAASLPSSCSLGTCDIDGNGSITVTDGVNVLRKTAGLPISENCPGGAVDEQIESLLQSSLSVFGEMTKIGVGIGSARAAFEQACENGGSIFVDDETGDIEYVDCTFGTLNLDGFFTFGPNSFEFDITFTDLTTGASESLSGFLSERQVGGNFVVSGAFDFSSDLLGAFSVEFDDLVTDQNGNFIGGSLAFSVEDAALPEVETIRMTFSASNVAVVDVFLADGSALRFNFNLVTGELTPASN